MGRIRGAKPIRESRIDNAVIAEWLAAEAETASGPLQKALRRAARTSFLWPEDAAELVRSGRSLTEFAAIGPFIEKLILRWVDKPPRVPETPPERRNFLTLTQARRILARSKIGMAKGDLQMHTTWSDGSGTVEQMAQAGIERGYEYIAITDHSKGLKIAGGIDERELSQQAEEIAAVNTGLTGRNFRVLRSVEMNLNPAGMGDMEPKSVAGLDLVMGSFHSRPRVTEDQTERYLAAIRNPHIQILGHPRGRIYNYRLGLRAHWGRVFEVAAKLDKAVELDAYPDRQDLDIELLKLARDSGVKLSIDTDAHHPEQLSFVEFGLAAAAMVKFPIERIVNFLPCEQLLEWASKLRKRISPRELATL